MTTVDILRMLDELHALVVERPTTLVGKLTWGLNADEASMQIHKIRASLPNELKQASARVRESEKIAVSAKEDAHQVLESARKDAERIILEGRKEAEKIIEQAKLQQERMVSDHEILKIAKAQAEELRKAGEREATQIRRGADSYALDVLDQLETITGKLVAAIDKGKQEISRTSEAAGTALPREKATLK